MGIPVTVSLYTRFGPVCSHISGLSQDNPLFFIYQYPLRLHFHNIMRQRFQHGRGSTNTIFIVQILSEALKERKHELLPIETIHLLEWVRPFGFSRSNWTIVEPVHQRFKGYYRVLQTNRHVVTPPKPPKFSVQLII
jgi:hypothetical protein